MEDDLTTKRIIHGVFGGIIVLCISVIALLLIYGKQANYQIYLQAKAISLHGSIGDTIPYQDIINVVYYDKTPTQVHKQGAGMETQKLVCADAKLENRKVRAYVYKETQGYIVIKTKNRQYIVNDETNALTKQLYQNLQTRIPK